MRFCISLFVLFSILPVCGSGPGLKLIPSCVCMTCLDCFHLVLFVCVFLSRRCHSLCPAFSYADLNITAFATNILDKGSGFPPLWDVLNFFLWTCLDSADTTVSTPACLAKVSLRISRQFPDTIEMEMLWAHCLFPCLRLRLWHFPCCCCRVGILWL